MSQLMKNMFAPGVRQQHHSRQNNRLKDNNYLKDHKEEQSDYERLLELCNSYGLNEEQTRQLMEDFSKGSYRSANTSFDHSILSDSNVEIEKRSIDHDQHSNTERETHHRNDDRNGRERSNHEGKYIDEQEGQEQEGYDEEGYGQQVQQHGGNRDTTNLNQYNYEDENQEYNEMTFNNNHDSLMGNNQSMMLNDHNMAPNYHNNSQINREKGNPSAKSKGNDPSEEDGKSYQETMKEQRHIHQEKKVKGHSKEGNNTLRSRNRQNAEKGGERSSERELEKGSLSTQYNKGSMLSSQSSEHSNQSLADIPEDQASNQAMALVQHDQQDHAQINHQYVKRLMRSFQLLEKENEDLKESILRMKEEMLNKEKEKSHSWAQRNSQIQELKQTTASYKEQLIRTTTMLQAQKEKSCLLMSQNQTYQQTITQLNSTVSQLTQLVKEKDAKNQELSQKICQVYKQHQDKSRENQSLMRALQGSSKDIHGQFLRSVQNSKEMQREESKKLLAKEESRKMLSREDSKEILAREESKKLLAREEMREVPNERGQRRARELTEIMMDSINISNTINVQNTACTKSTAINSNNSNRDNKSSQMRGKEGSDSRGTLSNSGQDQEHKKRSGSRVDVKKYKGMIQELRNTYNHANPSPIR